MPEQTTRESDSASSINQLKATLLTSLADNQVDSVLSREDTLARRGSMLADALNNTRDQELHNVTIVQENEKTKGLQLKNQQSELKIELEKQRAIQEGLSVPVQDPKPQSQGPLGAPGQFKGPKFPDDGTVAAALLNQDNPNIGQGLVTAVTEKINSMRESGQRGNDSETRKMDEYLRTQLLEAIELSKTEKSLSLSPFGQAGGLIGGLLDIVSGPLDIGTELFGGKITAGQRAELLTRAIGQTGPIVRAEMNDLYNRDRMELTAMGKLGRRGLANVGSALKSDADIEGADQITALAIDMRNTLTNDAKTHSAFGVNAAIGLGRAFNVFEDVQALTYALETAESKEEVLSIAKRLKQADSLMREPIQEFLANGGTAKKLNQFFVDAIDVINKKYQAPLQRLPGDKEGINLQVRQKLTAQDLTNKLADFRDIVLENIPIDLKEGREKKLGKEFVAISDELGKRFSGSRSYDVASGTDYPVKVGSLDGDDFADIVTSSLDKLPSKLSGLKMKKSDFARLSEEIISRQKNTEGQKKATAILSNFAVYSDRNESWSKE